MVSMWESRSLPEFFRSNDARRAIERAAGVAFFHGPQR
jgi:hypothetical protein